jgi:hypothetical protein
MGTGQGLWRSSFLDQTLNARRAYSPFAKTFFASRGEDFATASNVGDRRLKKRLRTNQWVMPKDRTLKKHGSHP